MRYILLTVALLSGGATYAQSISIGLRGGRNFNSTPSFAKDQLTDASGFSGMQLGAKATVDFKHFQVGAGFDISRLRYEYTANTNTSLGNVNMVSSTPLYYPHVFANYKFGTSRSYAYFGGTVGYAILGGKLNIMTEDQTQWRTMQQGNSISGGLQGGYNLSLTKRLSLQGEVGVRYIPLNTTYTSFDANGVSYETPVRSGALSYPITIGINYTIFK